MSIKGKIFALEMLSAQLEKNINETPTGETRNKLTNANIHVLAAISELSKIPESD